MIPRKISIAKNSSSTLQVCLQSLRAPSLRIITATTTTTTTTTTTRFHHPFNSALSSASRKPHIRGLHSILALSCWSLLSSSSSFQSLSSLTTVAAASAAFLVPPIVPRQKRSFNINPSLGDYRKLYRSSPIPPSSSSLHTFCGEHNLFMAKKKSRNPSTVSHKQENMSGVASNNDNVAQSKGTENQDLQEDKDDHVVMDARKQITTTNSKPRASRKRIAKASPTTTTSTSQDKQELPATSSAKDDNANDSAITDTAVNKPRATRKRAASAALDSKTAVVTASSKRLPVQVNNEQGNSDDGIVAAAAAAEANQATESKPQATGKKSKTAPVVQNITERDDLPKLWNAKEALETRGSYTFKIASWNVAGLRALLRNSPNALTDLLEQHDLDVLCLQETKLQVSHLDEPQLMQFRDDLLQRGYQLYYSCSVERKGYSGTAIMVRRGSDDPIDDKNEAKNGVIQSDESNNKKKRSKKQTNLKSFFGAKPKESTDAEATPNQATTTKPKANIPDHVNHLFDSAKVSYGIGKAEHDGEGRVIVMDFASFSLCNVYTPNSGQDLKRLSYRVNNWDKDFLSFVQGHSRERQVPMLWLGDLNIAHRPLDVYNDGAKHLAKQAGVTPQERASFTQQLEDSGYIDVFRHLHPTAQGHYTYWSTRANNRESNKGLRLDYFVCDPIMMEENKYNVVARDCYMLPEIKGSDHCPIVLELEIKKLTAAN